MHSAPRRETILNLQLITTLQSVLETYCSLFQSVCRTSPNYKRRWFQSFVFTVSTRRDIVFLSALHFKMTSCVCRKLCRCSKRKSASIFWTLEHYTRQGTIVSFWVNYVSVSMSIRWIVGCYRHKPESSYKQKSGQIEGSSMVSTTLTQNDCAARWKQSWNAWCTNFVLYDVC